MHSLVVQVFDRLDEKLFDLTNLLRLFARVKMSDLFLQAESEGKKVTVVSFELANDHMTFQYSARLVPQEQRSELPVSPRWQQYTLTNCSSTNTFLELGNRSIKFKWSIVDDAFLLLIIILRRLILLQSSRIFCR